MVIGFDPDLYTVSENDLEVFLTVRVLQGTLERPAVVNLSTANGFGICKYCLEETVIEGFPCCVTAIRKTCSFYSHTAAAVATDDYIAIVSLPLMFDGNDTSQTVRIIITNDSIVEFTEHFFASLTTVDPFVELMPDEARVNILDDDRKINEFKSSYMYNITFML